MSIKNFGEFHLIQEIKKSLPKSLPSGILGIGDDCAVVPKSKTESYVVTSDLLIENVHFIKSKISAYDLGLKSLAVNLSDIAAMGAKPQFIFVSIALPNETEIEWVKSFYQGLGDLGQKHHAYILGGDTTRSKNDLMLSLTVIGEAESKNIKLRSHAQDGDILCVTGFLGDSAAGLKYILENTPTTDEDLDEIISAHHAPRPHVLEGQWLAQHKGVHAMMDVSDGLASDIQRIMESSDCGACIELNKIPLSQTLKSYSKLYSWDALKLATSGSEDYCLLLSVDQNSYESLALQFQKKFNSPLYSIGHICSKPKKVQWLLNGTPVSNSTPGFDHFAKL